MRAPIRSMLLLSSLAIILAGCNDKTHDSRPRAKPEELQVKMVQPVKEKPGVARLGRARISTKNGAIQILEPDGTVTEFALEGENNDPFAVSEADLMMLNANLSLDLSGMPDMGPAARKRQTAQELALEQFAARTRPLMPELPSKFKAEPEMFRGATVQNMSDPRKVKKDGSGLVTVRANLRRGVDGNIAFAYATCALAGWADASGTRYARHVLTQQSKRNGQVQIGAVFTLSDSQPMGLKVMNTDQTLQECKARGIPAT